MALFGKRARVDYGAVCIPEAPQNDVHVHTGIPMTPVVAKLIPKVSAAAAPRVAIVASSRAK